MDEMQPRSVDLGDEVVERVEPLLAATPVVGIAPIVDELAQVFEINAVLPPPGGSRFGKPSPGEPRPQVDQRFVGNRNREGRDVHRVHSP